MIDLNGTNRVKKGLNKTILVGYSVMKIIISCMFLEINEFEFKKISNCYPNILLIAF